MTVWLLGNGKIHRLEGQRGETPHCPGARFWRGDVVRVRRTKALASFPAEAVVLSVVPPGFPPDWALSDLMGKPRPLMHQVGTRAISYILGNEGDTTPYFAKERHLLPTDRKVEIGQISEDDGRRTVSDVEEVKKADA